MDRAGRSILVLCLPRKINSCSFGSMAWTPLTWVALALALLTAVPYAAAQAYPSKPIRLILPFSGGTDLIGRMVGGKLAPVLGQQVVADPRYGAAGNIGWEAAAKAPADGYTLVMGAVPLLTNPHIYAKVGYDPLK